MAVSFRWRAGAVALLALCLMYLLTQRYYDLAVAAPGPAAPPRVTIAPLPVGPADNAPLLELGRFIARLVGEDVTFRLASAGGVSASTGVALLLHDCGGSADAFFERPQVCARVSFPPPSFSWHAV